MFLFCLSNKHDIDVFVYTIMSIMVISVFRTIFNWFKTEEVDENGSIGVKRPCSDTRDKEEHLSKKMRKNSNHQNIRKSNGQFIYPNAASDYSDVTEITDITGDSVARIHISPIRIVTINFLKRNMPGEVISQVDDSTRSPLKEMNQLLPGKSSDYSPNAYNNSDVIEEALILNESQSLPETSAEQSSNHSSRSNLTLCKSIRLQDKNIYQILLRESSSFQSAKERLSFLNETTCGNNSLFSSTPIQSDKGCNISTKVSFQQPQKQGERSKNFVFTLNKKPGHDDYIHKKTYLDVQPPKNLAQIKTDSVQCEPSYSGWRTNVPSKVVNNDLISDILQTYNRKKHSNEEEIGRLKKEIRFTEEKRFSDHLAARLEKQLSIHKQIAAIESALKKTKIKKSRIGLSPEMTKEIATILHGKRDNDILLTTKEGTIRLSDIKTLNGLNWLNDEVINTYLNLITNRSTKENYPSVHCFNTFFYIRLMDGYNNVRRWTRKVDVFSKDVLFFPIHLKIHWCLACIDFRQKTIRYYDSMGASNDECLWRLLKYLQDEYKDKRKSEFDTSAWKLENTMQAVPQQLNGSDCGVFACTFAEYLARDADLDFSQTDMEYIRKKMIYEILTSKLLM